MRYRRVNPRRRVRSIEDHLAESRAYNERHVNGIRAAEKFLASHPQFKRDLEKFSKIFRRYKMHGGDFVA